MSDVYIYFVGATLIISAFANCMHSSRCSRIPTPCGYIERDVVQKDPKNEKQEVVEMRETV